MREFIAAQKKYGLIKPVKTKKSCQRQDSFQNINPNITLEIKSSFLV
jgi:hypothetical protein